MKKIYLILSIVIFGLIFNTSYVYSQSTGRENERLDKLHKNARNSYHGLKNKIRDKEKKVYEENLEKQIRDYYTLAVKLEAQGNYEKSSYCYKQVLSLSKDLHIRNYVSKKQRELKKLLKKDESLSTKSKVKQIEFALPSTTIAELAKNIIDSTELFEEGKSFYENGYYLNAKVKFVEALEKDEKNLKAKEYLQLYNKKMSITLIGEPAEVSSPISIEELKQEAGEKAQVQKAEHLIKQGDIFYKQNNFVKAYQLYKAAFSLLQITTE